MECLELFLALPRNDAHTRVFIHNQGLTSEIDMVTNPNLDAEIELQANPNLEFV
jgi:hypothetical protein